jgi:glycosyltransferase involved in cell wall biosynthesis
MPADANGSGASAYADAATLDAAALFRPYTLEWYKSFLSTLGAGPCRQLGIYAIPNEFMLSVVVPIYNEEKTLPTILERIRAVPIRKEIVMVDDGSRDGTREILRNLETQPLDPDNRLTVVYHEKNAGKGAALRTGFQRATGDVVIVQDADLEYDPSEYPRLLQPIIDGKADVVYGSRFLGDHPHRVLYFRHYLGNQVLTLLSNWFTNLNLTDMETCYKVFRREALAPIVPTLKQNRFGFEPEVTAKIARRNRGLRIYEMSISYSGRTYEEGKKIGLKDGFNALYCIVRYWWAD